MLMCDSFVCRTRSPYPWELVVVANLLVGTSLLSLLLHLLPSPIRPLVVGID